MMLMPFVSPYFGAGEFSPADISGYAQHFDATALTGLSDGDAVAAWVDMASGNNATQATAGERPTYKTAIQNGLPVVRFDGGDRMAHTYANGGKAVTIFAVVKVNSAGNSAFRGIYSTAGNTSVNETMLLANMTTNDKWGTFGGSTTTNRPANTDIKDSAFHILTLSRSSGGGGDFYLDGAGDGAFADAQGQPGHIGGTSISSQFLTGDVAEIIVYSNQLSSDDRASVTDYLSAKWGIA